MSPYAYAGNNPLKYIDPTVMVIDSLSLDDWNKHKNTILDILADLNQEIGAFEENKKRIAGLLNIFGLSRTIGGFSNVIFK